MSLNTVLPKPLRRAPEYHLGGVVPNRLGLQVVRATSKHLLRYARPRPVDDPPPRVLEEEGVVLVHNLLDADTFRAVRREYEASRKRLAYRHDFDYADYVPADLYADPLRLRALPMALQETLRIETGDFPVIVAALRDSARIVAAAARCKIRRPRRPR